MSTTPIEQDSAERVAYDLAKQIAVEDSNGAQARTTDPLRYWLTLYSCCRSIVTAGSELEKVIERGAGRLRR
jgi:hypothetical protein